MKGTLPLVVGRIFRLSHMKAPFPLPPSALHGHAAGTEEVDNSLGEIVRASATRRDHGELPLATREEKGVSLRFCESTYIITHVSETSMSAHRQDPKKMLYSGTSSKLDMMFPKVEGRHGFNEVTRAKRSEKKSTVWM